jgi:hypothetical protein
MAMRYYAPFPGQNGEPFRAITPHGLRIGHAERDAAAADLGEHYVAGRLTLDELHERLGEVFTAKTYGQLTRVMADLPRLRRPTAQPGQWGGQSRPAQTAWAGAYAPQASFPPAPRDRRQATPSDRAARFAAVSLLILAMLIWLFTALIFARHGFYYHPGPFVPGR